MDQHTEPDLSDEAKAEREYQAELERRGQLTLFELLAREQSSGAAG